METKKYDLSCTRYYIVIAVCRAQLANDLMILNSLK